MTPEQLTQRIAPLVTPYGNRKVLTRISELAPRWFDAGAAHVALRWEEWLSDAAIEALAATVTGTGIPGALARLGSDRASMGLTLPEASADYRALVETVSRPRRRLLVESHADAAFSAGWWESFSSNLGPQSCIDPLSGLATSEYLAVRLGELYRAGAALDYPPHVTHALVVLHIRDARETPLARSRRRIEIGVVLRETFIAGETLATNGDDAYLVLSPRSDLLPETLQVLRSRLSGLPSLQDALPELWIEPLAASLDHSQMLVADVAKRSR